MYEADTNMEESTVANEVTGFVWVGGSAHFCILGIQGTWPLLRSSGILSEVYSSAIDQAHIPACASLLGEKDEYAKLRVGNCVSTQSGCRSRIW